MTTASSRIGFPSRYSTVTWLLPSGPMAWLACCFRTSASFLVSLWASMIGRGMSSGVSLQAKPNIMPWSPAPCSCFSAFLTPRAMSPLWPWTATQTPASSLSMP